MILRLIERRTYAAQLVGWESMADAIVVVATVLGGSPTIVGDLIIVMPPK